MRYHTKCPFGKPGSCTLPARMTSGSGIEGNTEAFHHTASGNKAADTFE